MSDLRSVAADIMDTLAAAIAELHLDIHSLSDRVSRTEKVVEDHDVMFQRSTRKIDDHTLQLQDMNRHLEDLDNRGHRHNLRVRGLPESIEGELVPQAVVGLFNSILGRPPQTAIKMDRMHHVLRPKGRDTDPSRDIVCCLTDYKLKEDLSGITLKRRRDLRPLLDALRAKDIRYKWKFPFCFVPSPHSLAESPRGSALLLRHTGSSSHSRPGLVCGLPPIREQTAKSTRGTDGYPSL